LSAAPLGGGLKQPHPAADTHVVSRASELRLGPSASGSSEGEAWGAYQRLAGLAAVGRLAAGIAHELSSPIQVVGSSAEYLRECIADLLELLREYQRCTRRAGSGHPDLLHRAREIEARIGISDLVSEVPRAVEDVIDSVAHAADVVRAMQVMMHPGGARFAPSDLRAAVQSAVLLARTRTRAVARVETALDPLPPVTCHAGLISQTVLNLILNAADAVEDVVAGTGQLGVIDVRCRQAGDQAEIAVRDNGAGIPTHVQPRVFEPFFTTKSVGRGTGQGLSIARAIVEQAHGGSLTFVSAPGGGTTFTVRLPLLGRPAAED
jgi:two-component system NtrC family sensor kinase